MAEADRDRIAHQVKTKVENWDELAKKVADLPEGHSGAERVRRRTQGLYGEAVRVRKKGVQIMGMAKGREFAAIAKSSPNKIGDLLRDTSYMERLGFACAVDYFLGNGQAQPGPCEPSELVDG